MSTYSRQYVHLSWATKGFRNGLSPKGSNKWRAYIQGLLRNKGSKLIDFFRGQDHVHLLIRLHPSLAIDQLVQDIKLASHHVFKKENWFPDFEGWQAGYLLLSVGPHELDHWKSYFRKQKKLHEQVDYGEELIQLLKTYELEFEWSMVFRD